MNTILVYSLVALLLIAISLIAVLLRNSHRSKVNEVTAVERLAAKQAEFDKLLLSFSESQLGKETLVEENLQLRQELTIASTSLTHERKQFEEKLELLNESRDQLSVAFKNIANEIFDDKSKKFSEHNKESLSSVLNPLREKISQFEKRVEDTYDKESKERFSLAKEIQNLQELNTRISEDAVNLTNALKGDNKAQGNWGEFVLESVLEKSGLVKGREYEVQVSLKTDEGSKYQPDVVVHLPESRDIIIDSKVSLKDWEKFCSSDVENEKVEHLKSHMQSVRKHVKELSGKDYQNLVGVNSLDFIFLFMPIEAAYSMAIQNDPELSQHAFEKNIIFVGPTTLLTTLKTVHNLWRLAQQNQNANEIAERAGALYDKFVAFVEDLEDVGSKIDASKKSYESAHNKLFTGKGNLVRRVETLKKLGAKTSKKHKSELLGSALKDQDESPTAIAADSDSDKKTDSDSADKTRH